MLNQEDVYATIPTTDLENTRAFYERVLGLEIEAELPGGIFYKCGNSRLLLFPSMGKASGSHTQAGWQVADIEAEARRLKENGVVFEEYDYPDLKTVNGIATMPGLRAAWFKDPEGNLFGVAQFT